MPVTRIKEFVIVLENAPGALGEFGLALAQAGINMTGFAVQARGDFGELRFAAAEPAKAEHWLRRAHYVYRVRDAVVAPIQDEPGALGRLAQRLAVAEVNVAAAYHVTVRGQTYALFSVDDQAAAVAALRAP